MDSSISWAFWMSKEFCLNKRVTVLSHRIQKKGMISCHVDNEDANQPARSQVPFYSIKPEKGRVGNLALPGR